MMINKVSFSVDYKGMEALLRDMFRYECPSKVFPEVVGGMVDGENPTQNALDWMTGEISIQDDGTFVESIPNTSIKKIYQDFAKRVCEAWDNTYTYYYGYDNASFDKEEKEHYFALYSKAKKDAEEMELEVIYLEQFVSDKFRRPSKEEIYSKIETIHLEDKWLVDGKNYKDVTCGYILPDGRVFGTTQNYQTCIHMWIMKDIQSVMKMDADHCVHFTNDGYSIYYDKFNKNHCETILELMMSQGLNEIRLEYNQSVKVTIEDLVGWLDGEKSSYDIWLKDV